MEVVDGTKLIIGVIFGLLRIAMLVIQTGTHGFNHAFVVAEMPNGKKYLIDATFRQFFDGPTDLNGKGRPGDLMRQTAVSRAPKYAI